MTSAEPAKRAGAVSGRLRSLDGLRGLAAVTVVLYHSSLLNLGVSNVYLQGIVPERGSLAWWTVNTPLQLLFSGPEAVLIFFVLSGLVVALPPLRRRDFSWIAYYPRRMVRLLLPVIASVLLASLLVVLTPRDPSTAVTGWAAISTFSSLDWREVVGSFDVLNSQEIINNPLWSLRYEVLFSLMLPLYVVLARVTGRFWPLVVAGCGGIVVVALLIGDQNWLYLPIFLLGTLIAERRGDIVARVDALSPAARLALGAGALIVGALFLEARNIGNTFRPGSGDVLIVGRMISIYGAGLIVLAAVVWAPFVRVLESGLVRWLGRISFSLYLVHAPLLVATNFFLRDAAWYWTPLVAIPIAFGVAELFERFIEGPAHRLSQRVGRWVDVRFGAPAASDGARPVA